MIDGASEEESRRLSINTNLEKDRLDSISETAEEAPVDSAVTAVQSSPIKSGSLFSSSSFIGSSWLSNLQGNKVLFMIFHFISLHIAMY
jgi:hypothetical protein